MENIGNLKSVDNGYVVLPVAEYNDLIRRLHSAECAIKVKPWSFQDKGRLEVHIDPDWLHAMATGQAMRYDLSKYTVKAPEELYISSVTLAVQEPTYEE